MLGNCSFIIKDFVVIVVHPHPVERRHSLDASVQHSFNSRRYGQICINLELSHANPEHTETLRAIVPKKLTPRHKALYSNVAQGSRKGAS